MEFVEAVGDVFLQLYMSHLFQFAESVLLVIETDPLSIIVD